MTSSLAFFPLPPKEICFRLSRAYFSLPCFPSSTTNRFTQQLAASTAAELLWLGTMYTCVSRHLSGHSWTRAQTHLHMVAVLRIAPHHTCSAKTAKCAGILLDVTGRAHPGHCWSGKISSNASRARRDSRARQKCTAF